MHMAAHASAPDEVRREERLVAPERVMESVPGQAQDEAERDEPPRPGLDPAIGPGRFGAGSRAGDAEV